MARPMAASTDDTDGYVGTANSGPGSNQRRTLTLTNGQVIWDFAGDVYEWEDATAGPGKQLGFTSDTDFSQKEWNDSSLLLNAFRTYDLPSHSVTAAANWNSTQGLGQIRSNYNYGVTVARSRGGQWTNGAISGVFALALDRTPDSVYPTSGFRVAR